MILNKINDRIGNLSGRIGIYYLDLITGASCFAGNCDVFPSSGMAKIAVLLEVFRQLHVGQLKKDDTYTLGEDYYFTLSHTEREPSYGALHFLHPGLVLTIKDLYSLMITVSDNAAFNILLKKVGMEHVNENMRNLGFQNIVVNREFFDYEKIANGIDNYHSVKEMGEIFRRLYMGQMISGKASEEIINLLKYHQRTNILPYYFKENQPIAHQSGFDEGRIHDMGIVYTDHPFILCMSADQVDTRKAESVMRDIVLICYENSENLYGKYKIKNLGI